MTSLYILKDKLAVPCDLHEWAVWFSTADRAIGKTVIEGVLVSTVFMGLDHNFSDRGDPLLFETMVFENKEYEGTLNLELALEDGQEYGIFGDCIRTSSWGEAEAAHKKVVAHVTRQFEKALEASSNMMYKLVTEECGQFS